LLCGKAQVDNAAGPPPMHRLIVFFPSPRGVEALPQTVAQPPMPQVDCFSLFCCGVEGGEQSRRRAISPAPGRWTCGFKIPPTKTLPPVDCFLFFGQTLPNKQRRCGKVFYAAGRAALPPQNCHHQRRTLFVFKF